MTPSILERCAEVHDLRHRWVGVYFLVADDEIVYVGQSTDVQSRLRLHLTHGIAVFDRAFWLQLDEDQLDAYEGAVIRSLRPKFCVRAPMYRGHDDRILAELGLPPHSAADRAAFESGVSYCRLRKNAC